MSEYVVRAEENGLRVYGNNFEFLKCKDPECICAGPADTGKTFALCLKVHLCACKYPGATIALVRKTQTSCYSTVVRTFTEKILGTNVDKWPCIPYGGLNRPERFNYDNGSVVFVSGLDKPSRLLSAEFDLVAGAQAEEFALVDWEILGTRATGRAGGMPYSQIIGDCNPSQPTHWIRSRAKAGILTLFNSTHRDNPELYNQETGEVTDKGQQRINRLKNLTGSRLMRLYHGLWAAPEGAIYDVFDEEKHVVTSFDVPPLWPKAVGIDPFGAYIAAVWLAFDLKSGIANIYREYREPFGLTVSGHVDNILKLSKGETVFAWVCGAKSERAWRLEFQAAGLPVVEPPITDVWVGIDRVYDLLKEFSLVVHDSCHGLLSEIGDYRRKLDRAGNPTERIENKDAYHCLDALRYLVAFLTQPQEQTVVSYMPQRIGMDW